MGVGRLGWTSRAVGARKTASVAAREDQARHASSDHGCARLHSSWTVTTSSRGRVGVKRDPSNVMARLAKVAGRKSTSEDPDVPDEHPLDPILFMAGI
ncbi:hypothetical protein CRG98_021175 [Punica granatum]|uniref:Uncharacterized protein n=1 Tax=Punica granatum TaxID=22663 RepID=A0A2I0JQ45_PUNGR|nr:hypothetical protein CRG98_021175 [Punica granatum]